MSTFRPASPKRHYGECRSATSGEVNSGYRLPPARCLRRRHHEYVLDAVGLRRLGLIKSTVAAYVLQVLRDRATHMLGRIARGRTLKHCKIGITQTYGLMEKSQPKMDCSDHGRIISFVDVE